MKKTYGYWDKETCYQEALKYQSRNELRKSCVSAYNAAWRNGWLKDYTWFKEPRKQKPRGYWNYEHCYQEALKYKTKSEFEKGCATACQLARKHGWMDDYYWFEEVRKPNGYWDNYEHCYQEALKYNTKKRVSKKVVELYMRLPVKTNGLMITHGLTGINIGIKKTCYQEALKYQSRTEFCKGSGSAYHAARKKGWLNDYTWFVDGKMKLFVDKIDSVYKYVFEDGAIYIGRTLMNRQKERHNLHKTDTVGKYAKEHNIEIPQMIIIEDNLTVTEGLEREDYWVNYYKDNGYKVINKAKTGIGSGSLGAIDFGKWNKENVFAEAKKYSRKIEFQKGSPSAYNVARRKGWIKEMDWLEEMRKPNGYWHVFENVEREGKKYSSRKEFFKGCCGAYNVALKNNWLDILFPAKRLHKEMRLKINSNLI